MSRTRRYQLLYVLAVVLLLALAFLVYQRAGAAGLVAVAVLYIVPGRLGGRYLGNLFRSRRLISEGRYNDGIDAGKAFLADLKRQPWRRHFIYCHFGVYTWDVEAMARNNIGAAHMELGDLDQAERELRAALRKDADYAVPYFNLAIVAYARGDAAEGGRLISVAAEKGYSGAAIDKLISRVGLAYSQLQARG